MVDHTVARDVAEGHQVVPDGYLLRVVRGGKPPPEATVPPIFDIGQKNDEFAVDYRRFLSNALLNVAAQAARSGDSVAFQSALDRSRSIDPSNPSVLQVQR
jgi:hypothetical protein